MGQSTLPNPDTRTGTRQSSKWKTQESGLPPGSRAMTMAGVSHRVIANIAAMATPSSFCRMQMQHSICAAQFPIDHSSPLPF